MIDLTRGLRDTAAMLTRELFMFVFLFFAVFALRAALRIARRRLRNPYF